MRLDVRSAGPGAARTSGSRSARRPATSRGAPAWPERARATPPATDRGTPPAGRPVRARRCRAARRGDRRRGHARRRGDRRRRPPTGRTRPTGARRTSGLAAARALRHAVRRRHRRRVRRARVQRVVRVADQRPQPSPHLAQRHPLRRLLDHERGDHVGDGAARAGAGHLAVDHLGDRRDGVAAHVVGRASFDRGEQRRAQPPQVGGRGHGLARGDLRRDVGGGAEDQARGRHRGVGDVAGDAEVGELDLAVVGDQDVARLDVAVGDPGAVRRAQCRRGGEPDDGGLGGRQHALLGDQRREVARRHHLQHDHRLAAGVDDVVDRDHVGVRQAAERARLAQHPLAHRHGLALGHARRHLELLDRDAAAQHLVVAGPHGAHRAAAQLDGQPVAPADQALLVVHRMHPAIVASHTVRGAVDPGAGRGAGAERRMRDANGRAPRCIEGQARRLLRFDESVDGRWGSRQDRRRCRCDERRKIPLIVA